MTAYTALKFKIMHREITYHMTNTTMSTFSTELTLFSTPKDMQYCQQLHVIDSHVHPLIGIMHIYDMYSLNIESLKTLRTIYLIEISFATFSFLLWLSVKYQSRQ